MRHLTKLATAVLGAAVVLGSAAAAQATNPGILGISPTFPDIGEFAASTSYSVSGTTGTLTFSSSSMEFKPGNGTFPEFPGSYHLTVVFNTTTLVPSSGSLSVINSLLGSPAGTAPADTYINSVTPTGVQFSTSPNEIGVTFLQGTGTNGLFAAPGSTVVVQISSLGSFITGGPTISTTAGFSAVGGEADTFAVPLPDAASLGLAGLMMLGGLAIWRKRSRTAD